MFSDLADPCRCPLCGRPNGCAMELERATGEPQPPCWCVGVRFAPELLARVPTAVRGRTCICRACADAGSERAGQGEHHG